MFEYTCMHKHTVTLLPPSGQAERRIEAKSYTILQPRINWKGNQLMGTLRKQQFLDFLII